VNSEERYVRQVLISQIGEEGQKKLARASVLVVGAGGLGSPILTYLAAAGVGHLGFMDSDTVATSNLNRQFLHTIDDIGRPKADSAREKLSRLNNDIEINAYNERLTDKNAKTLFSGHDIIIGAADSFETRFIINRACVSLRIPYIDGGLNGFSGCIMFSYPPDSPCLNCIFPETISKKDTTGVLGTTAGVIGTLEANIALLWLLGHSNPARNKLLLYDGLRLSIDHIEIKRNEDCPICNKDR
jgi:adenylyltransferase/sulfurtransferase